LPLLEEQIDARKCNEPACRYTSRLKSEYMLEFTLVESFEAAARFDETSDAELVSRIAAFPHGGAGEMEAELYRRLAPRVRLYGLRHLRDEEGAWDLVQQVLLITLEAISSGRLRQPEKLASFVLGTCRLAVLDIRRGVERRQLLLRQYGRDLPVLTPDAVPELDRERLRQCLERLAERERSVVVLTFYDQQTSGEVAGFLGLSTANVRVIRHRALLRLRGCMKGVQE